MTKQDDGLTNKAVEATLRQGGEKFFQGVAAAEIHDAVGVGTERQSGAGMKTRGREIWRPELQLEPRQRAVGNFLGIVHDKAHLGEGSEFLREYVDTTMVNGGGVSEKQMDNIARWRHAQKLLERLPPVRYPVGRSRGKTIIGKHKPVSAFDLLFYICIAGRSIQYIAQTHDWTRRTIRMNGKPGPRKVPDRQQKLLSVAFKDTLDILGASWDDAGYLVPFELMKVRVK